MRYLDRFPIARRIYLVSFVVSVVLAAAGAAAWSNLGTATQIVDRIGANGMPPQQSAQLRADINQIQETVSRTRTMVVSLALAMAIGATWFGWYVVVVLRRRIGASRSVIEHVRDGDLTTQIDDDAHDEFSPLLHAMAEMQMALIRVVGNVRSGVESVATASGEIANGNQDLSSRTEQQAGNLQQTAASLEQLTATVKQNTESAKQANQLASSASEVAARGGVVVNEVVATMGEIRDSSKKIAEIISVIDGIAFQTNILALNAAVEAARAGEQGRGFAVVASEVRNLAQRSAQAAREINTLISDSVRKVENGSRLVNQAGTTMGEIVAQVKRVTDLIGEITAASLEQSSGVTQVNEAVTQLDQTTQQNAALVQQSAAAAASLREQADRLAEAVAMFRLSRDQTRQVLAKAQAASRAQAAKPAPQPSPPVPLARKRDAGGGESRRKDDGWDEF